MRTSRNMDTPTQSARGFSLIELLVSVTLFIIVSGAVYSMMQLGTYDRHRASRRADIQKNVRVAVHMIGRDVLNAGLAYHRSGALTPDDFNFTRFGVPADADLDRDMVTSIIVGDNITPNNLNPSPTALTDTVTFAYRDMNFNGTNVIDLVGVTPSAGDPGVARLTTKTGTGAAAVKPYDVFLIESDTSQIVAMATAANGSNTFDAGAGDPLSINQPLDGVGVAGSLLRQCTSPTDTHCTTYTATAKRIFLVTYKVKPDGTLLRIVYGNNTDAGPGAQVQELPLAYNIEEFQIRYVLDDGSTVDQPVGGWQEANRIRQVQITVRVQSTQLDEQTQMPDRITLTATFSTRNLEYDAS